MMFYTFKEKQIIVNMTARLTTIYPIMANTGSKASLWSKGLKNGNVTKDLFELARGYYGKLWTIIK